MEKINNAAKKLRIVWALPALALLVFAGLSLTMAPSVSAAGCPKGSVKISHGCRNTKTGDVTCDKGYESQYDGSSLACVPKGTKQPTPTCNDGSTDTTKCPINTGDAGGQYSCGGPGNEVSITINLGCRHKGNAVYDMIFAIVRFLSLGVGLVLVGSMIWAGIQYTSSRGDPQATAAAVNRIRSNVTALLIFIFAYAILNYVVPGQILK